MSEQLRLSGASEEQLQEVAAVAGLITGFSAYLHGINYDLDTYLRELRQMVEYARSSGEQGEAKEAA